MSLYELKGPIWLMQPIPYFGEEFQGKWLVEPKFDGWRLQIIKYQDSRIEFWGRRLEKNPNWTDKLKYLIEPAKKIFPPGTLIDAELCSTKGRRFIPSLLAKNPKADPLIYIFDVVFYEGRFTGNLPLWKRKKIIQEISLELPFYKTKWKHLTNLEEDLTKMVKKGHEGIVVKKLSSKYELSRDGPMATADWRKIKPGR